MHLMFTLLLAALLTQATPPTKPTAPSTVPQAPAPTPQVPVSTVKQGGPPESNRYINWTDGTIFETTFEVSIHSSNVKDPTAPLLFPVINEGSSSVVDLSSVSASVGFNGSTRESGQGPDILGGEAMHGVRLLEAPVSFQGNNPNLLNNAVQMQFTIGQDIACWSSKVDEAAMASIPWPAQWPTETLEFQKPQPLIESDASIFADALQEVTGGNLNQVPPWIAAKELVRYCCNTIQVDGTLMLRGPGSAIRGVAVNGALAAASAGTGTEADLVCVSVALLRAAGIPARPVIGLGHPKNKTRNSFLVWGEFYLPDAGWIPFDPKAMRGKGVRSWSLDRSWNSFGNMSDLNKQIPLAYSFSPGDGSKAYDAWSVWGWSRLNAGTSIFPIPIEAWSANLRGQQIVSSTWNTPSVIHFTFINRGKFQP